MIPIKGKVIIMMSVIMVVIVFGVVPIDADSVSVGKGDVSKKQYKVEKPKNLPDILDLSDDQIKRIKQYRQQNIKDKQRIDTTLKVKNKALQEELFKSDSDSDKIESLKADISVLKEEKLNYKIKTVKALRTVLDPNQIQKLEKLNKDYTKRPLQSPRLIKHKNLDSVNQDENFERSKKSKKSVDSVKVKKPVDSVKVKKPVDSVKVKKPLDPVKVKKPVAPKRIIKPALPDQTKKVVRPVRVVKEVKSDPKLRHPDRRMDQSEKVKNSLESVNAN